MDKYDPQKKVALVVDEWGAWHAPLPGTNPAFLVQQNSLRDAILASLNLNIFARHADRVRMANIAQMINVLQAMILTDKEKMVLTPTYYVFKMYVPFQDATFVPVAFDAGTYTQGGISLPRVDAIAARDASGKLWLEITNLDPEKPVEIDAEHGRHDGKIGPGRDADGALPSTASTHLQHPTPLCRSLFQRRCERRQAGPDGGAEVGDGRLDRAITATAHGRHGRYDPQCSTAIRQKPRPCHCLPFRWLS